MMNSARKNTVRILITRAFWRLFAMVTTSVIQAINEHVAGVAAVASPVRKLPRHTTSMRLG
jgi:hypothetical protein